MKGTMIEELRGFKSEAARITTAPPPTKRARLDTEAVAPPAFTSAPAIAGDVPEGFGAGGAWDSFLGMLQHDSRRSYY